jgi:hypothetical protein
MTDAPTRPSRWPQVAPDLPIVLIGACAAGVLIILGRSMTFWQDEWGAITFTGGPFEFFKPVNEHWSTIPLLMYRATFGVIGLGSYLPYLAEVIVLHLVAVAATYLLIRPRTGRLVATLACVPMLLLGSGSENLFWAFQTGFVGSVAFGLWAIVLLERGGRTSLVGASCVLLASVMSSGMGLPFLGAAIVRTLLDPTIRRRVIATVPPAAVYGGWFLFIGSAPVTLSSHPGPTAVATFIARGVGHAVGAFSGLGLFPRADLVGVTLFGAALVATGWTVVARPRPPALAAAGLLAIVAMYATIGFVRAGLPSDFATRSRYVYVAAFFLILAAADWLALLRGWAAEQPAVRSVLPVATIVLLVGVTAANAVALGPIRARFQSNADLTRAYITLAASHRSASWIDPQPGLPGMPPVPVLLATIDRFGSPDQDRIVPSVVRNPGDRAREDALLLLVGHGFRIEPGTPAAVALPIQVLALGGASATWDAGCLSLGDVGPKGTVTVAVPTGSRLRVAAPDSIAARAILGLAFPPTRAIDLPVTAGIPLDVVVPDIGDAPVWRVRLDLAAAKGTIQVCRIDRR